jgi:sugar lactone lactonase YvrE
VDIAENKVFHLDTKTLELAVEQFHESVTCLALRRNGRGLACAAAQGFAVLEGNSVLKYLSKPLPSTHTPYTRFNDGACDSQGRFFAGTISSKEHNITGLLYRYDPADGSCVVVDEGPFTDSNGLGWSPDEKTLYFTDSLVNIIHAYDYDDGRISNRRVFVDALAQGLPPQTFCDGFCIDSEGCIWSARWGGSRITRFSAEGTVDAEILFPTALNITACCFGGSNEDQLYVTTAHCGAIGGDASRQNKYPDSGDLFVVDLSGQYSGGKWRHEFAG